MSNTDTKKEAERCRSCRRELRGTIRTGVTHPDTGETCKVNHYGGYVCSERCDREASIELERSMPGGTPFKSLSCYAQESLKRNWPQKDS